VNASIKFYLSQYFSIGSLQG